MKRVCLFFCVLSLFFFGCLSSGPLVTTLRDPSIPKEKHSVLTLAPTMRDVRIDGTGVGGSGDSGWGGKYPMVLLPEGEHRITAQYQRVTSSTYWDGSSTTTTSFAGDMSVAHVFKPGRFYLLYAVFEGNNVSLMITDETSPFVWQDSQERGRAQARNTAAREALAKLK
jgi:hypothetical protein